MTGTRAASAPDLLADLSIAWLLLKVVARSA